jgi:uncharacterized integral membrane protein
MGLAGDREPTQKMVGELTRDAGMLALVFGMLDALIKTSTDDEHLVHWWWYPPLILTSIGAVAVGIWMERTRKEER